MPGFLRSNKNTTNGIGKELKQFDHKFVQSRSNMVILMSFYISVHSHLLYLCPQSSPILHMHIRKKRVVPFNSARRDELNSMGFVSKLRLRYINLQPKLHNRNHKLQNLIFLLKTKSKEEYKKQREGNSIELNATEIQEDLQTFRLKTFSLYQVHLKQKISVKKLPNCLAIRLQKL